jgi:xylulokinase
LWLARHNPAVLARATTLLMPKDYINLRLTGLRAMDWSEAGSSFLSNPATDSWSPEAAERLGLDRALLPPLVPAEAILGQITSHAASETGLPAGLPVLCGTGDYPCALLGSGVTRPGQVSDITGTSFLLTNLTEEPLLRPQIMNIAMTPCHWGAFAVVDAAGDAIRWASRALDRGQRDYAAMSAEAATVPAGAGGLIFLPYLTGERLGRGETSRAAFLGLTAAHTPAHLHRAVMEGVVLAMQGAYLPIRERLGAPSQIIAAAGGARSDLWLQIKANVFDAPVIPTVEPESGLIGCACLGFGATGHFSTPVDASSALVRHREAILPNPAEVATYADLSARFTCLRAAMAPVDDLIGRT